MLLPIRSAWTHARFAPESVAVVWLSCHDFEHRVGSIAQLGLRREENRAVCPGRRTPGPPYWASRRSWFALGALAACGMALGAALHWHWDTYGALQLPLLFETGAAAIIAVAITSPFGEPERATGRWLPFLRLGLTMALSAAAGGALDRLRNTAGLIGIALLFAAWLGGGLAWLAPAGFMVVGCYALFRDWHGPAFTTPWIWPARPPHDLGGALCAGLVFAAGMVVFALRGARDRAGE